MFNYPSWNSKSEFLPCKYLTVVCYSCQPKMKIAAEFDIEKFSILLYFCSYFYGDECKLINAIYIVEEYVFGRRLSYCESM